MRKIVFSFSAVLLLSCSSPKKNISDLQWIIGKWEGSSDGLEIFEKWVFTDANTLSGIGGAVSEGDTLFSESIKIEQRNNELFYVPNVIENGGPVDFKFTGIKNDSIVFENPLHDFPKRIIYFKLPNEQLYACVDGINEGAYSKIEFLYSKTK